MKRKKILMVSWKWRKVEEREEPRRDLLTYNSKESKREEREGGKVNELFEFFLVFFVFVFCFLFLGIRNPRWIFSLETRKSLYPFTNWKDQIEKLTFHQRQRSWHHCTLPVLNGVRSLKKLRWREDGSQRKKKKKGKTFPEITTIFWRSAPQKEAHERGSSWGIPRHVMKGK